MKKKQENQNVQAKSPAFPTPQLKGKLLKRARESLRGTPEQNTNVLKSLLEEFAPQPSTKAPTHQLDSETKRIVNEFYFDDEVSRTSPNVKDYITITENNKKKMLSVKHLLYPMKELHGMLLQDNPQLKISLTAFMKLRPPNVLSFTKMPHNICCCQIHENLRCCLKVLKVSHIALKNIFVDYGMHKNFTCEQSTESCFSNTCEACKDCLRFQLIVNNVENSTQLVTWSKWVKTANSQLSEEQETRNPYCNIEKLKKTGSIMQLIDEVFEQVPEFLNHEYIKMNQAKTFDKMIETAVCKESDSAVLVCDFAEKFKCIQHNPTQSAHYGQTPISLFTAALYHRGLTPITIASDFEKQTKDCVLAYLSLIFESLSPSVKIVNIWSDNATSQFKNQYIMSSLKTFASRYKVIVTWNFFAAMHGKSVVDGFGGSVKRFVRRRIIADEKVSVSCAKEFVEVASTMEIKVWLLETSEIYRRNILINFNQIVKNSKKVIDIKKNHFFENRDVKVGRKIVEKIVGEKVTPLRNVRD